MSINSTNKNERFRRRSEVKEYGGYIEFERYDWNMMHNNAIALNCGRNALPYLCEAKNQEVLSSVFPVFFRVQSL